MKETNNNAISSSAVRNLPPQTHTPQTNRSFPYENNRPIEKKVVVTAAIVSKKKSKTTIHTYYLLKKRGRTSLKLCFARTICYV